MATRQVLVVEDGDLGRQLLQAFITRLGMVPTLVQDGASALAALDHQPFDLVLLDLHLPDMNGLEVVRRLRARAGGPDVRVLVVSGAFMPEERAACAEAGCDAFLAKPFTFDEFKRELQFLFANQSGANA
jgi:CheY-like chemotaxis protein